VGEDKGVTPIHPNWKYTAKMFGCQSATWEKGVDASKVRSLKVRLRSKDVSVICAGAAMIHEIFSR